MLPGATEAVSERDERTEICARAMLAPTRKARASSTIARGENRCVLFTPVSSNRSYYRSVNGLLQVRHFQGEAAGGLSLARPRKQPRVSWVPPKSNEPTL